jgi:putative MATE family efflux protein
MANPLDRDILRLAVPTLGALVAEPLFLIVDTALVGHLGAEPLAGLGIASIILQTAVGLLVFLAYATTPAVARLLGAGDGPGAVRAGIDGLWLALAVGVVLLAAGLTGGASAVAAFGATGEAAESATTFLQISIWGLPAMLLVLAGTGLMRGLQDARTPLIIVGVGFGANAGLNALFIYGFGWGIAGSAAGTVIAQWGMALWFIVRIVGAARRAGASLAPRLAGFRAAAGSGSWLLLRTLSLRVAMLATVFVGSLLGVTELAALQVALAVFSLLAFVLDALAIAGQAMIGHGLGVGDTARVREIASRLIRFGLLSGIVLGVLIAALTPVLGFIFTEDAAVRAALVPVTLLLALGVPLAGFVFVLDGVLIGAGDGRYLALTGIANLAVYLPLLALGSQSLVLLWAAFGFGYLGARAVTLGLRVRGDRWLRG